MHQGEKGILHATCQFNKWACPHVVKDISGISEQQPDIPGFTITLSRALYAEAMKNIGLLLPAFSHLGHYHASKFIPALASVLKLAFSDRFQIVEGVCHLSESGRCSLLAILNGIQNVHSQLHLLLSTIFCVWSGSRNMLYSVRFHCHCTGLKPPVVESIPIQCQFCKI